MTISYFISVPSFKSTAFVVWILARGGGGKFTPPPCFNAATEPPCTIGLNYSTLNNVSQLASYILVFMIKSLENPLRYSLTTFSTAGITSGQLYLMFWRAVAYLEMKCALKVVASTVDGASPD